MIKFKNEDTLGKFQRSGKEHDFHKKYEDAIERIRSQFGRKYTMLIDGRPVRSTKWFSHISPIDTRLVLGYFPKGDLRHAYRAIAAANLSAPTYAIALSISMPLPYLPLVNNSQSSSGINPSL
jgi:hypothetical protein